MVDIKQFGITGAAMTKASIRHEIDKNTLKYYSGHGVANEDYALRARSTAEGTKELGEIGIDISDFFLESFTAPMVSANWTKKEVPSPLLGSSVATAVDNPTFAPSKPIERVSAIYFYEGEVTGSFTVLCNPSTGSAVTHLHADFVPAGADDDGHLTFTTAVDRVIDSASAAAPKLTLTLPAGTTVAYQGEEQARDGFRQATFNFNFFLTQDNEDQTTHIVALDDTVFAATDVQAIAKFGSALDTETDLYSVEQSVSIDGINKWGTMTEKITYYDNQLHYEA